MNAEYLLYIGPKRHVAERTLDMFRSGVDNQSISRISEMMENNIDPRWVRVYLVDDQNAIVGFEDLDKTQSPRPQIEYLSELYTKKFNKNISIRFEKP